MALTAASTKGFGEFTFTRGARRYRQSLCARAFRRSLGRSDVALPARPAPRRSRYFGRECPSTTWDHAISATFAARYRSDKVCSICCPDNNGASSLTGRLLTATFRPRYGLDSGFHSLRLFGPNNAPEHSARHPDAPTDLCNTGCPETALFLQQLRLPPVPPPGFANTITTDKSLGRMMQSSHR